jgi:hypothetical protein
MQSKSAPAEKAIKLTVFQQDEAEVASETPKGPQFSEEDAVNEAEEQAPKLRESKQEAPATPDVSAMVKKWAKKKGS